MEIRGQPQIVIYLGVPTHAGPGTPERHGSLCRDHTPRRREVIHIQLEGGGHQVTPPEPRGDNRATSAAHKLAPQHLVPVNWLREDPPVLHPHC